MIAKSKERRMFIYTWDWKGFPAFNKVYSVIEKMGFRPIFTEVETKSDDLCVIVSMLPIESAAEAKSIYDSCYNDSMDEQGKWEIVD